MKKRVISLLLALVLAVSLLPTAAWAAETGPKGKGTADDPYLIAGCGGSGESYRQRTLRTGE